MSNLSWVTPPGTVANFVSNTPVSYELLVYDNANNGAYVSFALISGSLPSGLTLSASGVISGTPAPVYSSNNKSLLPYNFVIRATSQNGYSLDGAFTVNIINSITNKISWITPSGSLGTVPSNEFYQIPLQTQTIDNSTVTYKFLSGKLPVGMEIALAGYLQGVPTFVTSTVVDQTETFTFTVRATSSDGTVSDRSFSIGITDVSGPIIEPTTNSLGTFFDGSYYTQQLTVAELNPVTQVHWSIKAGALPSGITLSPTTGLLSGYIQPIPQANASSMPGYNKIETDPASGAIIYQQEYDYDAYDFNNNIPSKSQSYTFTVQAYDGANYDLQDYTISVVSRSGFTADSSILVNDIDLTVDATNVYTPILLNNAGALPNARQDGYYAYKFDGIDLPGDSFTYNFANDAGTFDTFVYGVDQGFDYLGFDGFNSGGAGSNNLPGLILDSSTGWLYGKLNTQISSSQTYDFGITLSKIKNGITYTSNPKFFTLTVLGDVNNRIEWTPSSNLGSIDNGSVSELFVSAKSVAGKDLTYSIYDAPKYPAGLPQGLTLLPSGEISGRVSFEAFVIDEFNTTFDNNKLTFDRTFNFTVQASAVDGTATSIQTFTLALNVIDQRPYVDLYLTAMPRQNQKNILQSIFNNTTIFNPEYIYRPTDPWFGVANTLRMLFIPGLNSAEYSAYAEAIINNHWTKQYDFGAIKTAVVFNSDYTVKYEVVYVEVLDPEENSAGQGAPLEINLAGEIANPFVDSSGKVFDVVYPNNSANMVTRLVNNIGYYDQSSLPNWMSSDQLGTSGTTFSTPLGYVKAVVLAYTKPGYSKKIAYNLSAAGINFQNIDFTVDRYNLDNIYSKNFNTSANVYITGYETTFDYLPVNNIGEIIASVNYAVSVPFNQINGRTVDYINSNGGIDGIKTFQTGDTLIFAKQENFTNPGPFDGWVDYTDSYIGDDILTSTIEGYGSEAYDQYSIVPGYLESAQSTITFTGSNTQSLYTLSQNINNSSTVSVYVNNILQPTTSYTISGSTLAFNTPPGNVILPSNPAQISVYSGINLQTFSSNGTVASFTLGNLLLNPTTVVVNGVVQSTANYSVTGSTLTFNTAPPLVTYAQLPPTVKVSTGVNGVNERGGIWRIDIVNDIVNLIFVSPVNLNSRIQVVSGQTYAGSIVTYTLSTTAGHTVPYYVPYKVDVSQIINRIQTTFNAGTTRFFSNRDQYYAPGSQDQYLKFPQYNVFQ